MWYIEENKNARTGRPNVKCPFVETCITAQVDFILVRYMAVSSGRLSIFLRTLGFKAEDDNTV
jgi:hypothetical protein